MITNEEAHMIMVHKLVKPGKKIKEEMTWMQAHLMHMALGICSEAGELGDAIKKHVIYQKDLDRDNVVEELGDLEFYMEGVRACLCISRDEVLEHNFNKLAKKRYPNGYSDEAAIIRMDKEKQKPDA